MTFFKFLKLQFRPLKIDDSDFGQLTFMFISNHHERSYWEAEWTFPPTGTPVSIGLDGDESSPGPETQEWNLGLAFRFDRTVELARSELAKVFKSWLKQDLPDDNFSVLKLSGFGVGLACGMGRLLINNRGSIAWHHRSLHGDAAKEARL
jgi:hypothetical protein